MESHLGLFLSIRVLSPFSSLTYIRKAHLLVIWASPVYFLPQANGFS